MQIKDAFTIGAPVETVWAFLQDIPRVSTCVPGIQEVAEIAPDVYRGQLKVKVGPLSATFSGRVTILERVAPERMVAQIEGEDKASASFVKATFTSRLKPVAAGTEIEYEMDVALRGRLAQFGFTVVRATAKKMTAQFAKCVQEALTA